MSVVLRIIENTNIGVVRTVETTHMIRTLMPDRIAGAVILASVFVVPTPPTEMDSSSEAT